MLKLMYALCYNGESEVINFLMEDHGIDILKHIFEKARISPYYSFSPPRSAATGNFPSNSSTCCSSS